MFRRLLVFVVLTSALIVNYSAQAQLTVFDPALRWQQLETPHFKIVYHQGLEGIAQETAIVAEESYELIKKEFGKVPADKTYIVIFDVIDSIVGSATPLPQNTIYIGPAQMRLADWANVRLDSWIRTVVYHELLHIMDSDLARGWNALLRSIFGRIVIPNISKPIPFIEGLAVYEKYKHLGESRLNDANTIMMIRQMVLDNKIPRFGEIAGYYARGDWPHVGLLVYNFGAWFLKYIEETYGADSMKKFNEVNSSRLLNLLSIFGFGANFNDALKKALGKSADEVYTGFQSWLRQKFSEEIQAITREGLTSSVRLTRHGWGSGQPAWSPDGREIVYRHNGPGRNGVRLISADGQNDREVLFGPMQLPSFSPDGKSLVYTKLDYNGLFYAHSDLYLYDLEKKTEKRLTHGARAYVSAFAPDGSAIYFAHHIGRDASTAISVYDLKTQKVTPVKEFSDNSVTMHSIAVSPNGKTLALSSWRRGGYQDIYLLNLSPGPSPVGAKDFSPLLEPVTQDKDEDLDPSFSPDGEYILFSSDRGTRRVANLYAYKLSDGSFYRVTNVLTGAFDPAVSPDGHSVLFTSYSSDGYDVHKMPFDPQNWKPVSVQKETILTWAGFPKTDYPIKPYDPFGVLWPKLWLPIGGEGMIGIVTMGQDVLSRHTYQLMAGWDFQAQKPVYWLEYVFAQFWPIIALSLSEGRDESKQGVGLMMPLDLSLTRSQIAMLTYWRSTHPATKEPDHPAPWTKDLYTAQYSYQSVRGSDLWHDTLSVSVQGQLASASDAKPVRKLTLTLRESLRLPVLETHLLSLKLNAGWSDAEKEDDKFSLGGSAGGFALRGFAADVQKGQQALTTSVEYRFPLFSIERGVAYWPIFLDDVRGSFFVDVGLAGDTLDINNLKIGFGTEIGLSLTTGYFFNWAFRVGVAQGLGEASPKFYLSLGF